jgi:hypothetical protein
MAKLIVHPFDRAKPRLWFDKLTLPSQVEGKAGSQKVHFKGKVEV